MSYRETEKSRSLGTRVADLKARMREAQINEDEMKTFQKVAAFLEDSQGHFKGDDLIAASFVATPVGDEAPERP